jgi:hypothetical protein
MHYVTGGHHKPVLSKIPIIGNNKMADVITLKVAATLVTAKSTVF